MIEDFSYYPIIFDGSWNLVRFTLYVEDYSGEGARIILFQKSPGMFTYHNVYELTLDGEKPPVQEVYEEINKHIDKNKVQFLMIIKGKDYPISRISGISDVPRYVPGAIKLLIQWSSQYSKEYQCGSYILNDFEPAIYELRKGGVYVKVDTAEEAQQMTHKCIILYHKSDLLEMGIEPKSGIEWWKTLPGKFQKYHKTPGYLALGRRHQDLLKEVDISYITKIELKRKHYLYAED